MKIASAVAGSDQIFGIVTDGGLADLRALYRDPVDLLERSRTPDGRAAIEKEAVAAASFALEGVQLLPPIARPERILCVGTNYHSHVAESDQVIDVPDHPMIFTRFPSSLVGNRQPLVRPQASTAFDYEGELAVIIGRDVHNAAPASALDAVAGYSCLMDGTLRDFQRHTSQFTPGKNFDRSGSWGPWIVTADEINDPETLTLETILDGEVVQSASTSQLIFDIGSIIAYCSTFTTLRPGDVIATGTPGGVGYARSPELWLTPGSSITVRISGVGSLTNHVIAEEI